MPLTQENKKRLRAIGHQLRPVVTVAGKGLSESVCAELDRALSDHELIKLRLAVDDRTARARIAREICERLDAELVQEIGKVLLVYRHNPRANPRLSNLHRSGSVPLARR